jgi:predicted RNA-binding protein with RPS1 domain
MTNEEIKQIKKELNILQEKIKVLDIDIEPDGRVSESINRLSDELDDFKKEVRRRFDRLEHQNTQLLAKIFLILDRIDLVQK